MQSVKSTRSIPCTTGTRLLPFGGEPAEQAELVALFHDVVCAAERTYPAIDLPRDIFAAYVCERMSVSVPRPVALRQLHTTGLYLACACARGDRAAIAAFDDHCLRGLDRVLQRMGIAADAIADIKQEVRGRVLLSIGGRARILDYSGRGDLRGWIRVIAVRQALRHRQRRRQELAVASIESVENDALLRQLTVASEPAADRRKAVYRQEFKRAFEAALRALHARDRTLLQQHYVDGLTVDELASLYRVHRSTAARLVARARQLLFDATRLRMMAQLEIEPCELESILRLIRSQVEISLRVLRRARKR